MTGDRPVFVAAASFEQERLWLLEQLAPGTPLYNVHFGLMLSGEVDPGALQAALTTVVSRHEVLRTAFQSVGGQLRQVIYAEPAVSLRVVRHAVAASRITQEATRLAGEHARGEFDLTAAPLLHADLVSFSDRQHAFLLTLHHTVFDGWSAEVLFEELSESYLAALEARSPELPPLPLQYADFAEWQRDAAGSQVWSEQLSGWSDRLVGAPEVLNLPADRPRPAGQGFCGELAELAMPAELEELLVEVCRRNRATRFAVLFAAFAVAMGKYSGESDLVLGTVVSGRTRVELERLIGLFTNTVALRIPVCPDESFTALLATVRSVVAEAQSFADVPFARVVQELRPTRARSHNPLFQVMFDVQPGGGARLRLPGIDVEPLRVRDRRISLFDLSVSVETESGRTRFVAEYSTELFDRATGMAFLRGYRNLLACLLRAPESPVRDADPLDPAGRQTLLVRWGAAGNHRRAELISRIRDHVSTGGTAPAIVSGTGPAVTYGDLDRWSSAVTAALRAAGVGRGDVVALRLGRSAAAVAAILGVHRLGAAYLPVDPGWPSARISELLHVARPAAVLVADGASGPAVVPMPPMPGRTESALEPWHSPDPDELAYVLFTSGSSGKPKGVLVRHGGLANYVRADHAAYGLVRQDRILMFAALTFDVSAEEIFPALAAGAALVPRTEEMLESAAEFFAGCARFGVTVTHLPTAFFHHLVAGLVDAPAPPECLRVMAIGGETPDADRVGRWLAAVPGVLLSNVYGPTETTIAATIAKLDGGERVTLGEPIAGTSLYLLDDSMRPVPDGAVGQLYLGGAGLARGYLDAPARTAETFVPHPFARGERLYRTGDLARCRPNGGLEFRGRTDLQVKIRGFRIEPAEVEAALTMLPEVADAAVAARPGPRGDNELVGYVVPAAGARIDETKLRRDLAALVPRYLVPALLVTMEELPLTAHDKVDRAVLPELARPTPRIAAEPPAGEYETAVAEVWRVLLDVSEISRHDDFFALGGHSLLAAQVVSSLRARFGTRIRLTALFEHPVLSEFAAALERAATMAGPPVLRRAGRGEALAALLRGME
ncbi:non-ribosomal peptide synthetase [Amycolatopsis sp. GA6-003]|uniref:non-ribosomal peptide synthetase n=1 Tax=Amycolatopsis sp. GA6-003 TaxID=2652444 RepID=UPI0039173077